MWRELGRGALRGSEQRAWVSHRGTRTVRLALTRDGLWHASTTSTLDRVSLLGCALWFSADAAVGALREVGARVPDWVGA